jgi:long-chain acyl-CoA synthetase
MPAMSNPGSIAADSVAADSVAAQSISAARPGAAPKPAEYTGGASDAILRNGELAPTRVALRRNLDGAWHEVTAGQFRSETIEAARGLVGAGLRHGDRLAIMSRTRYEWSVLDVAALALGIVVVPIYETSSASQLEWILVNSGASALVVESAAHEGTARGVLGGTSVRQLWQLDDGGLDDLIALGQPIDAAEVEARRAAVTPEDLATIIYTSGTTGRPKGAEITHRNLLAEIEFATVQMADVFAPQNATLLFLPLAHVFGRVVELVALSTGCVLGHAPDTKTLIEDLAVFRPTFILSVPRVFEKVYNSAQQKAQAGGALKGRIFAQAERTAVEWSKASARGVPGTVLRAKHAVFDHLVYSKLRTALGGQCATAMSGGAALGERLGHFFRGAGITVLEGYGLTETTAAATANLTSRLRIGTVGKPIPQVELQLGSGGEIMLRGGVVFRGYWDNPDATAEAIDAEGWFHTGDLGSIDADGYLRITGRSKEIIVTAAGKNVAPAPLEDKVRASWLIGQCMVVGEGRPFVAALITIDPESWPLWLQRAGADPATTLTSMLQDPALLSDVQSAIDEANASVSRAESIRAFRILGDDWTEAGGQITPSLKLKRSVVLAEHEHDIEALYSGSGARD